MEDAIERYKNKFGDTPTTVGIPPEMDDKMTRVLERAIEDGERISDADFMRAIGLEPLPEGALA